jgi:hypothetical protein
MEKGPDVAQSAPLPVAFSCYFAIGADSPTLELAGVSNGGSLDVKQSQSYPSLGTIH